MMSGSDATDRCVFPSPDTVSSVSGPPPRPFDPKSMDAVIARMKFITRTHTLRELADYLVIQPEDLAKAKKKGVLPPSCLSFMTDWMRVNPQWLLEGEGSVYTVAQGIDCSFEEMMRDPELSPVVVPVYAPFYSGHEDGGRPETFRVLRNVVLSRVYVPDGLLVFEEEPRPEISPYEYRSALVGVDVNQRTIEADCTFAFFFQQVIAFCHVGPAWASECLNKQGLGENSDAFPLPEFSAPNVLGRVIWRFESAWNSQMCPKTE